MTENTLPHSMWKQVLLFVLIWLFIPLALGVIDGTSKAMFHSHPMIFDIILVFSIVTAVYLGRIFFNRKNKRTTIRSEFPINLLAFLVIIGMLHIAFYFHISFFRMIADVIFVFVAAYFTMTFFKKKYKRTITHAEFFKLFKQISLVLIVVQTLIAVTTFSNFTSTIHESNNAVIMGYWYGFWIAFIVKLIAMLGVTYLGLKLGNRALPAATQPEN